MPVRGPTPSPGRTGGSPVSRAAEWFLGANDAGTPLYDPVSGGGCDGLERDGRNENQGAESTLALMSTLQQARARLPARRDGPTPEPPPEPTLRGVA
jgi:hypothetical protein